MKRGATSHILQALLESHGQFLKSRIPIESQIHFRRAKKELLMGIRTCIDDYILESEKHTDKETSLPHSNHQAVKKIKISDEGQT